MYCSNCGKEINNDVNFCSGCGNPVRDGVSEGRNVSIGHNSQVNIGTMVQSLFDSGKSRKVIFLVLTLVTTIIVALSGVFPVVHCEVGMFGYSVAGDWTLFDIWKKISVIEDWGLSVDKLKIFILIVLGCYAVCVVAACKAVLKWLSGGRKYDITNSVVVSMVFGNATMVILYFLVFLLNRASAEQMYGMKFLSTTAIGWDCLFFR